MRSLATLALGLAALVLNPMSACFGPSFDFDAKEMRGSIEGTWQLTVPARGAAPAREIRFAVAQGKEAARTHAMNGGLVSAAAACGNRSLVKNAEACMDVSHMPLAITLIAGASGTIPGELTVYGTSFSQGELETRIDGELLHAQISPAGTASQVMLSDAPSALVRVSSARATGSP
jgi:hypothetical protein